MCDLRASWAARIEVPLSFFCRVALTVVVLAMSALIYFAPQASAQDLPPYQVTGFRDARFGMAEQEVRAVAVKDFALKPTDIPTSVNPVEGTTVLTAKLASLDPGPGPAVV